MLIFSVIIALLVGAGIGIMYTLDQKETEGLKENARNMCIGLMFIYIIVWGFVWYLN